MGKRLFRVDGGNYGGELTVGIVSADFVRYWQDQDQDDLIEYISNIEWGEDEEEDNNSDSPPIFDDPDQSFNGWYEIDDIEHMNNCFSDSTFTVHEVTGKEDLEVWQWTEDSVEFEPYHILGRECYADKQEPEDPPDDADYVPVLMWLSSEKGSFGSWFVETDGEDFDPKKFAISTVETDLAELVDCAWYNKNSLETQYDYCDSRGKGYYAYVGWLNRKWLDSWDKYDDELMQEFWEGYDYHNENEE